MRQAETPEYPEADRAAGCAHPREVYELIGHEAAEHKFIAARKADRLHHAWLITGGPGIGKATLAYRMIRSILGGQSRLEQSLDIPASDPVSQRVESLGHGDLFVLRRPYDHKLKKLRSEIPVSEARGLTEFFSKRPSEGGWRVCLIDSMDEMNRNSENAILKSLEEPPERAILILISNHPGRLLPTIRSRCLTLSLREVPESQIAGWLRAQAPDVSEDILTMAAKLSRGAPGRALSLTRNAENVLRPLSRFLDSLDNRDARIDQKIANTLAAQGQDTSRALFWDALQDVLRSQTIYAHSGAWEGAFKPIGIEKDPERWREHWTRIIHLQNREAAINMDKKSVMQDVLASIRAR